MLGEKKEIAGNTTTEDVRRKPQWSFSCLVLFRSCNHHNYTGFKVPSMHTQRAERQSVLAIKRNVKRKKHTAYPPCILSLSSHQETAVVYFSAGRTSQQIVLTNSRGCWVAQLPKTEGASEPTKCETINHCIVKDYCCQRSSTGRCRLTLW